MGCCKTTTPCPSKKSELYSSLWKSCDELRGGMDGHLQTMGFAWQ